MKLLNRTNISAFTRSLLTASAFSLALVASGAQADVDVPDVKGHITCEIEGKQTQVPLAETPFVVWDDSDVLAQLPPYLATEVTELNNKLDALYELNFSLSSQEVDLTPAQERDVERMETRLDEILEQSGVQPSWHNALDKMTPQARDTASALWCEMMDMTNRYMVSYEKKMLVLDSLL